VEIKIGISDVSRELSIECSETTSSIEQQFLDAFKHDGILALSDPKGRRLLVPASKIAYVDVGQEHARAVGFGSD